MDDAIVIKPRRTKSEKCKTILMDNLLVILLIIAVGLGVLMGFLMRNVWSPNEKLKIFYLAFPGDLLLNMLKCLILPLIISSLITGMAALDKSASGKLGGAAVVYYLTTTLLAVILGIILVVTIRPGYRGSRNIVRQGSSTESNPIASLLDLLRNCFPDHLVTATFQRKVTEIKKVEKVVPIMNGTMLNSTATETIIIDAPMLVSKNGMNILGIVVFSIALGCVINYLGPHGKPLKLFFESLNAATMVLVKLVIWYSPIGIMFMVATKFIDMEEPAKVFEQLLYYFLTVMAGLGIHGFIVLPLIYFIATRKNPFLFFWRMSKAVLTAWGTASSSATLPITMECLVNRNKIHRNVVRFVAPVGATINMDGTALYEAVAAIFIAQYNMRDLSVAEVIIVSLTATAAAIGAAGVPQAGLVTMVIVLTAVDLPTKDVTLILAIDWFLDRFRTAINVLGDSFGAGILAHVFRNTFSNIPDTDDFLEEDMPTSHREDTHKAHVNGDVREIDLSDIYPSLPKDGLVNNGFNTRM